MAAILRTRMLAGFNCLGDRCADTCCKGWSMQMDEATLAKYKNEAPQLLEAVEPGGEGAPWIMRKNAAGFCVRLEGGLCGIHKEYGDKFLGDACHFYPRATRGLDTQAVMTAAPSCPEITRLMLESSEPFALDAVDVDRLPFSLKQYLPAAMTAEGALAVHQAFLAACEDTAPAETIMARLGSVSRSIERIDRKDWPQAVPFYLKHADARLPPPEINIADPFNLLHALCGLIVASQKPMSERLKQTVADMERALAVTLDWQQTLIHIGDDSAGAYQNMHALWQAQGASRHEHTLRRYLAMQLSLSLYPFAGLGDNLEERITLIGVRLATVKLALMSAMAVHGPELPGDEVVRIIQSLSRFLDHLGDAAFSLQIYRETGWTKEGRMRGLLKI